MKVLRVFSYFMRNIRVTLSLAALIIPAIGTFAQAQSGPAPLDHRERTAKNATLFPYLDSNRRLETVKPDANGIIDLAPHLIYSYPGRSSTDTPEKELAGLARVSDAIIEGVAERRESALTSTHSSVFNEWTIRVTRILKNDFKVDIPFGKTIIGAQSGGDLVINGIRVQAHSPSDAELSLQHKYILYLGAVPESQSFTVRRPFFDVTGDAPVFMCDPKYTTSMLWEFCAAATSESLEEAVMRSVYP
jgi:hypothetical protein